MLVFLSVYSRPQRRGRRFFSLTETFGQSMGRQVSVAKLRKLTCVDGDNALMRHDRQIQTVTLEIIKNVIVPRPGMFTRWRCLDGYRRSALTANSA
jgi:hypothetical protein